jgi:hypothetical protein
MINPETESARQILLRQFDFDIFTSPMFIEAFICKSCGFTQTKKQVTYDATSQEGLKIEIKHSALILSDAPSKGKYFAFHALQGTTNKGKSADVFVLVGYADERLRFFVVPAHIIGKRKNITIQIQERLYRNTGKWLNFEVTFSQLADAVKVRGRANGIPSSLFPSDDSI